MWAEPPRCAGGHGGARARPWILVGAPHAGASTVPTAAWGGPTSGARAAGPGRIGVHARDMDPPRPARLRLAGARAAVVGGGRRDSDVPPRPRLPACTRRDRVRRPR